MAEAFFSVFFFPSTRLYTPSRRHQRNRGIHTIRHVSVVSERIGRKFRFFRVRRIGIYVRQYFFRPSLSLANGSSAAVLSPPRRLGRFGIIHIFFTFYTHESRAVMTEPSFSNTREPHENCSILYTFIQCYIPTILQSYTVSLASEISAYRIIRVYP